MFTGSPGGIRNMENYSLKRFAREDGFDDDQADFFHSFYLPGKQGFNGYDEYHYTFLVYPMIPAPIMREMAAFADAHTAYPLRIPLWKLGQCAITDPVCMRIALLLLDVGFCLPDHVIINDTVLDYLRKVHAAILEADPHFYDRGSIYKNCKHLYPFLDKTADLIKNSSVFDHDVWYPEELLDMDVDV